MEFCSALGATELLDRSTDPAADRATQIETHLGRDLEIVVIRTDADELEQVNRVLKGREPFDAIHLIGHGASGVQRLGATAIVAASLAELKAALGSLGAGQQGCQFRR